MTLASSASDPSRPRPARPRFFRAGGFDQVRLETAADLTALRDLDRKLWVALSCPARGLEIDSRLLEFLDSDQDGRVRASELLAAVDWAGRMLTDIGLVLNGATALPLAAIADPVLLASAREILKNIGKSEADSLSVADIADTKRFFLNTRFNGDGVVPASASDDPAVAAVIADIIVTLGGDADRGGEIGVSQAKIDLFFAEAQARVAWWDLSLAPGLLPLADVASTAAGFQALAAVRTKIDDYFLRCRLAAYDPRATDALNRRPEDYARLGSLELSAASEDLLAFPIALAVSGGVLPLAEGINPVWAAAVAALRDHVVRPLLGERAQLSEAEWRDLTGRFDAYAAWQSAEAGTAVAGLSIARLRQCLGGGLRTAIEALIAQDLALKPQFAAMIAVERLVRYHRDLGLILNNFVSFRDFYTRRAKAVFQAGTLYIDGRSCELCLRIDDPNKHAVLGTLSHIYLLYCDCTRNDSPETLHIAAAVTAGDSDQLVVGRNGVFYDRQGRDWDATVVKILDHPISIQQAFWSPYKSLGRMLGEQIAKLAAARAKDTDAKLTGAMTAIPIPAGSAAAAPAPFDVGRFAGIFAALGLAVGAIGTAVASVLTGLLGLPFWEIPLALAGLLLLVSGPSMVIAYLKLRQRTLGPILDANGWAINARAKINIPFGASLTAVAKLPDGAERSLTDPFAEKVRPWRLYGLLAVAVVLLALAFRYGHLVARLRHLIQQF